MNKQTVLIFSSCLLLHPPAFAQNVVAEFPVNQSIIGSPAIADDSTVYVGSSDTCLYAFHPNGTVKWRFKAGKDTYTPSIANDGTIYFGSSDYKLYAVNPDGTMKWSALIGLNRFPTHQAIDANGVIYIFTESALYAFEPNGSVKWQYFEGVHSTKSVALGPDGTVYFVASGSLHALSQNGTLRWRLALGTTHDYLAIDNSNTVYVVSEYRTLNAINPDGTVKWKFSNEQSFAESNPVIANDSMLYISSHKATLAIDANGTLQWEYTYSVQDTYFSGGCTALGSDNTIYSIRKHQGDLFAVDHQGRLIWRYAAFSFGADAAPAIDNQGRIYVDPGYASDRLVAVSTQSPQLASGIWPKAYYNNRNTASLHSLNCPVAVIDEEIIEINNTNSLILDGSSSTDVDGDNLSYSWRCIERPYFTNVTIAEPNAAKTIVTVSDSGTYRFSLTVTDNDDGTSVDFVTVTASNVVIDTTIVDESPVIDIFAPPFTDGDVEWIDYDNDGDMDFSVSGVIQNGNRQFYLLRNDNGVYAQVVFTHTTRNESEYRWVDYNRDNRIDLTVAIEYGTLLIFLNQGDGQFSQKSISLDFSSARDCDWVDYDLDGDADLMLNGALLYRNEGNDLFVQAWRSPYQGHISSDWGDYNNDGYPDLIMQSIIDVYGGLELSLYTNDGRGNLEETKMSYLASDAVDLRWFDYDSDGYQDILVSSLNHWSNAAPIRMYKNQNGSGGFSLQNIGNLSIASSDLTFGDYDNDGDPDLLLSGRTEQAEQMTTLLYNSGNRFVDANVTFPKTSNGRVALSDYDHDGDLDVAIMSGSSSATEAFVKIFKNQHQTLNQKPSAPTNLSTIVNADTVTFSWDLGQDAETPAKGLTYNLRVGTTTGASDIISPLAVSTNGSRIVARLGNAGYNLRIAINNFLQGTYFWSVQAIDQGYAASEFAEEQSFTVTALGKQRFVDIDARLQGVVYGAADWGDYDADGDLDVVITGWSSYVYPVKEFAIVYRNDNGTFANIDAELIGVTYSAVAWGDYNNDGLLDLVIAGQDSNDVIRTDIYKNLGNDRFANINAGISGRVNGSLAWGDYDNDGDLDLLVSGDFSHSGYGGTSLYRNEGRDRFTNVDIDVEGQGKIAWADFDNDGNLDFSVGARVFRNHGANRLIDIGYRFTDEYSGQQRGPIVWGDYDADGDLDILADRTIYRNENSTFTKDTALPDVRDFETGSSVFADMDNDGDLDVLLAGYDNAYGSTPTIRFLTNDGTGTFTRTPVSIVGAYAGTIAVGDYDADGDLDILLTGSTNLGGIAKIYRNDGVQPNTPPTPPTDLTATFGKDAIFLKWAKSDDAETPGSGLTYNLRIGTTAEGVEVKNPSSNPSTGQRFQAAIGNVNQVNEWPFRIKKSGTYYWAVQAIDNSYGGSEFSAVHELAVPNTPPLAVSLLYPLDDDTLDHYQIPFRWSHSEDAFSDTLSYALRIFNSTQDTVVANLADTSHHFNGAGWIVPGIEYHWLVFANDDRYSVASLDTFTFVKRKLDSGSLLDSTFVYITGTRDSVTIFDHEQKVVAQLLWEGGAVQGDNDTLRIGTTSNRLVPPGTGAQSYSLSNPLLIEPKTLNGISFVAGKVKLRLFADTTVFRLSDLESHIEVSRIDEKTSTFEKLQYYRVDNSRDWAEIILDGLNHSTRLTLSAKNILMGNITDETFEPRIEGNVLVPRGKTAILHEGLRWHGDGYNLAISVAGKLVCHGSAFQPVILENLDIRVTGSNDSSFQNNVEMAECDWLQARSVSVNSASARITNSRLRAIAADKYADVHVNKTSLYTASSNYSKLTISESSFDSTGYFGSVNSIVTISASEFKFCTYESSQRNSFISLKDSKMYVDAFLSPIQTIQCFLLYDGNRIIKGGNPNDYHNRVGISVFSGNYAIIRNNIVSGFRSAVEVGYDNEAVIYNNTFANNEQGVRLYATPDTVSIYNNIFYNNLIAIDLAFNTYAGGVNVSHINNNLWKEKNPNHVNPYVSNGDKSIIIGNEVAFHEEPGFEDLNNYRLTANSPAIDHGARDIPAFAQVFSVLDTAIETTDNIEITNFQGAAPDIGALEFQSPSAVNESIKVPKRFQLFQNYPNPFWSAATSPARSGGNPATTIEFDVPQAANVELTVYNILGEKVETLASRSYPPGTYKVQWSAENVSAGVYFFQMKAGDFVYTRKLLLLR